MELSSSRVPDSSITPIRTRPWEQFVAPAMNLGNFGLRYLMKDCREGEEEKFSPSGTGISTDFFDNAQAHGLRLCLLYSNDGSASRFLCATNHEYGFFIKYRTSHKLLQVILIERLVNNHMFSIATSQSLRR